MACRTPWVLGALVALAAASPLLAQGAEALEPLAAELARRPNLPRLHLDVARAYFQRGAQGDALRVRRHLDRAVQLSPGLADEAREMLQNERPGVRTALLDPEERLLDDQIQASLAATPSPADPHGRDAEAVIQAGLAERMVQRDLENRPTSMEDARAEFGEILDWEGDSSGDWAERLGKIRGRSAPSGWRGAWQDAVFRSVERFGTGEGGGEAGTGPARAADAGPGAPAGGPDPGQEGGEDSEGEPIPDPLLRKNQAILDFYKGNLEEAVVGLIDTVAAAEVRRNLAQVREQEAVSEEPPPAPPPEAPDAPEVPAAADPSEAPPAPQAPPPPSEGQPGSTPPELVGALGQAALETLEAMANPEVTPSEVGEKVAETAALGAVGEPLLLDLDGSGTPDIQGGLLPDGVVEPRGAVRFDLDGDGHPEWTEWVVPGRDGLLAVDLDQDGAVTSGRELFGTALGDRDGFRRLAVFDLDGDGWVQGPEAATLLVWMDDGDGRSAPEELRPLADLGVTAVSCQPQEGVARARTARGERRVWEWLPDTRPRPPVELARR